MTVSFTTSTQTTQTTLDTERLLTDLATEAGLSLDMRCACKGVCGGCAVVLHEGRFAVGDEELTLTANDEPREVLACKTRALSEAKISVPPTSLISSDAQIHDDFVCHPAAFAPQVIQFPVQLEKPTLENPCPSTVQLQEALEPHLDRRLGAFSLATHQALATALGIDDHPLLVTLACNGSEWVVIDIQRNEKPQPIYAVAIDIGTTTVAAMLVDMRDGSAVGKASLYNQQVSRADDIASRISYGDNPAGLEELRELVVEKTINVLINQLCERARCKPESIYRLAVSGNTVMSHLFAGISPASIGRLPFEPVTNVYPNYCASELGIKIHPQALVDIVPSIAGYIGGDITSDLYTSKMSEHDELTLMVDIGTNGEMVLSENREMVACATAAGPAFEGGGIRHGCRAAAGAIEHISIGPGLSMQLDVIGSKKPHGICGSAVIDFIAEGMRCGLINTMGRFDIEMLKQAGRYESHGAQAGTIHACTLVTPEASDTGKSIYISEYDVSQVLKAKGAIYAGMKTLLELRGKSFADLNRFVLAGGFARHIYLKNAICIGLLPELQYEQFEIVGNGSLAGAYLMLVEEGLAAKYRQLIELPESIELNLTDSFESHYIDALGLPNMDEDDFPVTVEELEACQGV